MNIGKISQSIFSITAVAFCSFAIAADAAELRAVLSTREAYVGAPVTLQVEIANASAHDEPSLPDIAGLDIRSAGVPSRSTQTTIINGRRSVRSSAIYSWQIVPRRAGTFEIPAITVNVDGQSRSTRPLRFVATKSETADLLFVEVTGEQQQIYVGQPLELTLNVWIKPFRDAERQLTLSEGDMWQMISESTNWGAFSDRLQELADNRRRPGGEEVLREDASGAERAYYRYQLAATIYPKRPGQIDVGDVQVVVNYPTELGESRDPFGPMFDDDFFGRAFPFSDRDFAPFNRRSLSVVGRRPVVAGASVASLEVTPVPTAGKPADYRGAVGRYKIFTQATPTSVKAGDPITLHIGIMGDGPMELVQAPPLAELPQLTADFKVTDEPLAGLVEGDAKVFTTSIRPRRAGITEIPAVPLSYFDPNTEEFVTVQSEPIAIEVGEAEQLSLGSIVGGAGNATTTTDSSNSSEPKIDLTNHLGTDALVSHGPSGRGWFLAIVVTPSLIVGLVSATKYRRRWYTSCCGTVGQKFRSSRREIEAATTPSEVASAIRMYAASMLRSVRHDNAPAKGRAAALTREEVVTRLQVAGHSRTAEAVDDVLAKCAQAAYAGVSHEQVVPLKTAANKALGEVAAKRPRQNALRLIYRGLNSRRTVAAACLLLAGLAVSVPAAILLAERISGTQSLTGDSTREASAVGAPRTDEKPPVFATLTAQQKEVLLAEANAAYQQGQQAAGADAAAAKEAFATAATKYQMLADSGIRNADLHNNLANAYWQAGSIGRAIANYERSLQLAPWQVNARMNLNAARATVPSPHRDLSETTSFARTYETVRQRLNDSATVVAVPVMATTAWLALCVVLVCWMVFPSERWRHALIPVACVLAAALVLAFVQQGTQDSESLAVVATETAVLRQAPGEAFDVVSDKPLPEGETLTVLKHRGGWLEVESASGINGWIAVADVETVRTS